MAAGAALRFGLFFAALAVAACGDNELAVESNSDAGAFPDAGTALAYSVIVLPDTQYYSSSWPDIFAAQTRWILDNKDAESIAFVLHTGDIVDFDDPSQWQVASDSLHVLDGQVPYVITAGNHDYKTFADRMGMGSDYFSVAAMSQFTGFGGTFEPDHIENSYSIFDVPGDRWLVLALEFGPRDEVLAWADGLLKQFADIPAIMITHAYMASDGNRYDHVNRAQRFDPHDYAMAGQNGSSINDGEEMWTKLVVRNPNLKMVFSGHDVSGNDLPAGTVSRLTSARPDGSTVHQVLANYQTCVSPPCECLRSPCAADSTLVRGGNGYLRILKFMPQSRRISVRTYSPYVEQELTDSGNRFTLPMN